MTDASIAWEERRARVRILWSLLRAELAAGVLGLRLFMACVGVASLMLGAVWVLGDGLSRALTQSGTTLLGGDAAVSVVNVPLDDDIVARIGTLGEVSKVAEMRTSARVGEQRITVEVKGIDDLYPLFGAVTLQDGAPFRDVLSARNDLPTAIVEPAFLARAGIDVGDTVQLGEADFRVGGVLAIEPDRLSAGRFMVGPRILVETRNLAETGLMQFGALIDYRYRLRFPTNVEAIDGIAALAEMVPERGWELESPADAGDRVRRTVDRTTTFLGVAGLVALIIGLAGAWASAQSWILRRGRTIALYRLSGATPSVVILLHASIILVASLVGLVVGLGAAFTAAATLLDLVAARLHLTWDVAALVSPALRVTWILVLGLIGTSVSALSLAAKLSPGAAMRSGETELSPDRRHLAVGLGLIVLAVAAAVFSLPIPAMASAAAVGLIVAAGALGLSGWALAALASRRTPRGFTGMVTLQSLRQGGAVAGRAIAIGIGIAGITAIVAAQHSLETALRAELPERIPDLVLIDVQPDQVADVEARISAHPALGDLQASPMMRAQILAVNGVPAAEALVNPDKSWVIEGDRSFSWAAEPTGAELLAGEWWEEDYAGEPLISAEEDVFEAFDLKPGDKMTYSVLGRPFTSTVVNIRKEYHRTFRPEFLLVASPEPFRSAPQGWVMSLQGDGGPAVDGFIRELATAHPNVTSIDIRVIVERVSEMVEGAVFASLIVAATLLIAGALSLTAVVAADVDARRREAMAYALIGASRAEIATARLMEAASVGALAAILGGAVGWLGGYVLVGEALRVAWAPGWVAAVLPFALGVAAALAAGIAGGLGGLPRGRGQVVRYLTS